MPKISACVIIRNEEKYLQDCLIRIKDFVDEIIIVHDGKCDDKSLAIAREYTNQIYVRPFKGACEFHYKFAFSKARYDWILKIDADELVSEELGQKLKVLVNNNKYSRYFFLWTDYDFVSGRALKNFGLYKSFLFSKQDMIAVGILHFPIITRGQSKKIPLDVYHVKIKKALSLAKIKRWSKLHAKQLKFKDYDCFQGDKNDYGVVGKYKLLLKCPLIIGLIRAIVIFFKDMIKNRVYLQPIRFRSVYFSFIYNLMLAWQLFKLKYK